MRRLLLAMLPVPLIAATFLSASAPVALSGCGCDGSEVYGLSVQVTEAGTGKPVTLATVTVRDGDYVDVIAPGSWDTSGNIYLAASERAGVYDIDVVAEGYAPAHIDDVEVGEDRCHVDGRSVDVELTPSAPLAR